MSLEKVTSGLKDKVGDDCGLGASVKFDFGADGVVFLDALQTPNVVNNADTDAQCTMTLSMPDFIDMISGELNSTTAFMTGKLKIAGDMQIAMRLASLLA